MTDNPRGQLKEQFLDAFEGADYPVNNPMDLVPALPDGPATKFELDGETFTAMELQQRGGGEADFPYEKPEPLVEDILDGMEEEEHF